VAKVHGLPPGVAVEAVSWIDAGQFPTLVTTIELVATVEWATFGSIVNASSPVDWRIWKFSFVSVV
jgi:hypothetical protein